MVLPMGSISRRRLPKGEEWAGFGRFCRRLACPERGGAAEFKNCELTSGDFGRFGSFPTLSKILSHSFSFSAAPSSRTTHLCKNWRADSPLFRRDVSGSIARNIFCRFSALWLSNVSIASAAASACEGVRACTRLRRVLRNDKEGEGRVGRYFMAAFLI
jgi:hypothetical protein